MECNPVEDFLIETDIPVLDPPPGFEDVNLLSVDDRFYDDPFTEDVKKPVLCFHAVSSFASQLAFSIVTTVVKPKIKLRTKKYRVQPVLECASSESEVYSLPFDSLTGCGNKNQKEESLYKNRHSIAVSKVDSSEPVHMSLEEVRSYLKEFQDTSTSRRRPWMVAPSKLVESPTAESKRKSCFVWTPNLVSKNSNFEDDRTKRSRKSLSMTAAGIKQALFSVFRIPSHHLLPHHHGESCNQVCPTGWTFSAPDSRSDVPRFPVESSPNQRRALPPVPLNEVGFVRVPSRASPTLPPLIEARESRIRSNLPLDGVNCEPIPNSFEAHEISSSEGNLDLPTNQTNLDFAASIEAVKDHGWYWGPLSGDAAEKILSNEPDGSFLVRDSSDDHYIFSLSFKLNGGVRHVRIEHDHGNFSFGSVARFKSQTMVEFIDKAIEHSRSGRFLFFLHRRPTHGPTRVQLLHPVSRFRQVQSLQHLSRFVILKLIRRDQIGLLPLPKRLREYLNTTHYYSEQMQGSLQHS